MELHERAERGVGYFWSCARGSIEIGDDESKMPHEGSDERLAAVGGFDDIAAGARQRLAIAGPRRGIGIRDEDSRSRR